MHSQVSKQTKIFSEQRFKLVPSQDPSSLCGRRFLRLVLPEVVRGTHKYQFVTSDRRKVAFLSMFSFNLDSGLMSVYADNDTKLDTLTSLPQRTAFTSTRKSFATRLLCEHSKRVPRKLFWLLNALPTLPEIITYRVNGPRDIYFCSRSESFSDF